MDTKVYKGRHVVKYAPGTPTLGIGLAVRAASPVEFWISQMQMIPPLNVKIGYYIQKGANAQRIEAYADVRDAMRAAMRDDGEPPDVEVCEPCGGSGRVRIKDRGKLGAAARNEILKSALADGVPYVLFYDDDVLCSDMTAYRMWVNAQKHPEAAAITGIYVTKVTPSEPLLYADAESGAFWDWPLGALVPVHSAGAGCQIVNMEYVKKIEPPWFNDTVIDEVLPDGSLQRRTWGHDRYFHVQLQKAGGVVYADTGLLCGHWDVETQHAFVVPPDAPCFQQPPEGEAFVPFLDAQGLMDWRRLLPRSYAGDARFLGYMDWLAQNATNAGERVALVQR